MAPADVALVQDSFKSIVALGEPVVEVFNAELVLLDPSLRTKLDGDLLRERKRLLSGLAVVVGSLPGANRVTPADLLETKLADEEWVMENFASFGVALLRTFKKVLGDGFGPELSAAWMEAFRTVVDSAKPRVAS